MVKGTNQDRDDPRTGNSRGAISTHRHGEVVGRVMSPGADESSRNRGAMEKGPPASACSCVQPRSSGHLGGQGC